MKSWITSKTTVKFKECDKAKEKARKSKLQEDWDSYKVMRNECTSQMRKDNQTHFRNVYNRLEAQNDTKGLYLQTN